MLFAVQPAAAQTRSPERIAGKCEPGTTLEGRQFQLLGYSSSRHISCEAVEADWEKGRIAFIERGEAGVVLSGTPDLESGGLGLTITHMQVDGEEGGPAKGKCQMFRGPGPADPRNLVCVITHQTGFDDMYTGVSFIADEHATRPGETERMSGACQPSDAMDIVLRMELERRSQRSEPNRRSPPLLCDTAVIVGGQSVTFSMRGGPGSVTFIGKPDEGHENEEGRIWVTHIRFGDGPVLEALVGTCVPLREFDGRLITACGAAFEQAGEIRLISAEFHPAAATASTVSSKE